MEFTQVTIERQRQYLLSINHWQVLPGQHWLILGTNGSGKSLLAGLLDNSISPSAGSITGRPANAVQVSLEAQQTLYERELYRDETDLIDKLDHGTPVRELLLEIAQWSEFHDRVVAQLHLESLLERGYRLLSSGEGRRVMLARALLGKPDLLILDEPFEGLDHASCAELKHLLGQVMQEAAIVLIVNQASDNIDGITHLALLHKGQLQYQGKMPDSGFEEQWHHLLELHDQDISLPQPPSGSALADWQEQRPLVELIDGRVRYENTDQFRGLNWTLPAGQHTQIAGPNGCGKSTLLQLITGDHPQCYANNLSVFGYRRGQGESIWQIKKHLGMVSGSLHRDYRVSGNVLTAVVSGLKDSIGVYQQVDHTESQLAMQWLKLIGLADKARKPFRVLSTGEQRLVLIARALIKQPPLLILDEPTQGLDDYHRHHVLTVVSQIIESSPTTLLFVSHRQDETLDCIRHRLEFQLAEETDCLYQIDWTAITQ